MRTGTVSYRLEDLKNRVIIPIGFVGENDFTRVIFDAEEIYKKYPSASVSMKVQPPKGGVYPAAVTRDGNNVIWQVKEADVANRGGGELQLTFIDGETKIKTYIAKTDVKRSLAGNGPAPDPVQDWIDDADAKLAEVEQALEDIPNTIDAALEEAKESGEFDGPPGPPGEDGKDGRDGVDGKDGKDGQDGAPGQDGKDGKDGQDGRDGRDGTDGTNGTDGADAYVWIRYAAAEPTADADMKTTPDAWIGIYSGDAATAPEHYTDYTWYKIKGDPGQVQDVQIDGISILQSGIANVPIADTTNPGVVKASSAYGTFMQGAIIGISKATNDNVKGGTNETRPIVPYNQHTSVFYALAKLAGADMKNSSNAVGVFTTEALVAIQKMLGIYEAPWELIREDTVTNATEADVEITTDDYGLPFELTDIILRVQLPKNTNVSIGNYGLVYVYDGNNAISGEFSVKTLDTSNNYIYNAFLKITQTHGMLEINFSKYTTTGNASYVYRQGSEPFKLTDMTFTKTVIKSVTGTLKYTIYGKRKWRT